jgi:hypothetical protein
MKKKIGWIGVDLDGTLAHYEGWKGEDHIGDPVPAMVDRVKRWISEGNTVKIFTARVYGLYSDNPNVVDQGLKAQRLIRTWAARQGLPRSIEVTCLKDSGLIELWDDRAVQVVLNKGRLVNPDADQLIVEDLDRYPRTPSAAFGS